MSVQATNSTKFQEFHGLKLAGGAAFANLIVEKLLNDPLTPAVGRFWFNTTTNKYKMVSYNGTEATVLTFTSEEDLAQAIVDLKALLAADSGATLVGYAGKVGTNGNLTVAAGKIDAAFDAIVVAVDAEIKRAKDEATADRNALAATTGAELVGYAGKVGANGKVTVAEGTAKSAVDSLVDQVDAALSSLGDDAVSKTATADQTIASNLRILKDVIIDGDVTILGANTTLTGNTVTIGDNIILLNSEVAADAVPAADAGWEVNRGIEGTLRAIFWKEADKTLTGTTVTTDVDGVESYVQSRVILGTEFDLFDTEVTGRVEALETQVNGKIGDLTALATEDKSKLVLAINELHADAVDDRNALAAATGSTLVGYAGKAGDLLTVAEGTVSATFDALVTFANSEAAATDTFINDVASTTAGKGSNLVGYSGYGAVEDAFFVPAGTVQASLSAVVVAIQEDRAAIDTLGTNATALITSINAKNFVTTSSAAETHTIVHNLGTTDIGVDTWFKDGADWVNHSASCKIVDTNTISYTLTTAAEIKVLVKSFAAVAI